jgi:hypothetical protein
MRPHRSIASQTTIGAKPRCESSHAHSARPVSVRAPRNLTGIFDRVDGQACATQTRGPIVYAEEQLLDGPRLIPILSLDVNEERVLSLASSALAMFQARSHAACVLEDVPRQRPRARDDTTGEPRGPRSQRPEERRLTNSTRRASSARFASGAPSRIKSARMPSLRTDGAVPLSRPTSRGSRPGVARIAGFASPDALAAPTSRSHIKVPDTRENGGNPGRIMDRSEASQWSDRR